MQHQLLNKQIFQRLKWAGAILFLLFALPLVLFSQPNPQRADITAAFKKYPASVHKNFVAKVFDCDENKKPHEFTMLLTPDGFIQFGSNPKIEGRQSIEDMLVKFNKKFKHLSQHIHQVFYDSPTEIVYAADATYSFEDGTDTGAIPYMVHLKFNGQLVDEYRIYIDLSPFYKMAK